MRKVREITSKEENFRVEPSDINPNIQFIKRDPIETEPIGTLLLMPMRVVGYDKDCDGSLMARLEMIDLDEIKEGLGPIDPEYQLSLNEARNYSGLLTHMGLYPSTGFVVTREEIIKLMENSKAEPAL